MQHKIFCVREFIKTALATAVQRAFRLRFNIQPPTRKSICRWNHQFEQMGCLFKGKSSGRPRVSEENVRRIQESSERSPPSQPVEPAENLEYRNQLSGVCWGAIYCSSHTTYHWYRLFAQTTNEIESVFLNHAVVYYKSRWPTPCGHEGPHLFCRPHVGNAGCKGQHRFCYSLFPTITLSFTSRLILCIILSSLQQRGTNCEESKWQK